MQKHKKYLYSRLFRGIKQLNNSKNIRVIFEKFEKTNNIFNIKKRITG